MRVSPTLATVNVVNYTGNAWYLGTTDGHVYRSRDLKIWEDIPFSGQLNGQIADMQFYGCSGVLLYNELVSTGPDVWRGRVLYTINGYNWESLTVPPNRGLWSARMLNPTEFYAVGSAYNGHGTVIKGTAFPFA